MSAPYHHGNLREELLALAIETLHEKGVEQLSLRALARELEVSHTAPLRHFATKADLLNAIAVEGVQRLITATEIAMSKSAGVERLRAMALAYVTWSTKNSAYHQVIRNPDVTRHASDELNALLSDFASLQRQEIKNAQASGWRSKDDPEVLFLHLVSLIAGSAIVATDDVYKAPMGAAVTRKALRASIDLFLK